MTPVDELSVVCAGDGGTLLDAPATTRSDANGAGSAEERIGQGVAAGEGQRALVSSDGGAPAT
jgi:hypothetical protein